MAIAIMGNCIRRNRSHRDDSSRPARARNQPLRKNNIKWKSETPLTIGQLYSRRDEFWETAVVFDGKKEIWDGLRAATLAAEQDDFVLAQAILDGANICTPNGTLSEAYDELGNKYVVPIYCLSRPLNLLCEEDSDESPTKEAISTVETVSSDPADLENHVMRLRLNSSGQETEVRLRGNETIAHGKRELGKTYSGLKQRWYYGGRLLQERSKIKDLAIPNGHVVQVVFCPIQE